MRILTKSVIVVGLLFTAASCGSDKKSSDTTVAAVSTTPADTASDATATGDVPVALSATQQAAVTKTVTTAAAIGVTIDPVCLSAVVAKMSDADAQLIVDQPTDDTVTLSPEGEALSGEAEACATGVVGATATSTATS